MSSQRGNGEGSVYRVEKPRRSGVPAERWVAQVRIDGQQRRTFSATEAEAKRSLRQLLKAVDDGRPVADGNLQLSALLDQWESKVVPNKNIKGSTIGRHKWALNILRADLGSTKVRTLGPERVEKALTDRAQAGYSRSSLTKLRGTLSQVLKWGVRRDLVARNVATVVQLPAEARAPKVGRAVMARCRLRTQAHPHLAGHLPRRARGDHPVRTEDGAVVPIARCARGSPRSIPSSSHRTEASSTRSRRDLVEPRLVDLHLPHRTSDRPDDLSKGVQATGRQHRPRWLDTQRTPPLRSIADVRRGHADRAGGRSTGPQGSPHAPEALSPPDSSHGLRRHRACNCARRLN